MGRSVLGKHVVFCDPVDNDHVCADKPGSALGTELVWVPGSSLMFSAQPHVLSACSLLVVVLARAEPPVVSPQWTAGTGLMGSPSSTTAGHGPPRSSLMMLFRPSETMPSLPPGQWLIFRRCVCKGKADRVGDWTDRQMQIHTYSHAYTHCPVLLNPGERGFHLTSYWQVAFVAL